MDERVKNLWISALRSGEFKQGRGYLELNERCCALGVLSVLALMEGVCTYDVSDGLGKFDNKKYTLSFNVMKWAGIAQENARFLDPREQQVLLDLGGIKVSVMELNDSGKSFSEISRFIEKAFLDA